MSINLNINKENFHDDLMEIARVFVPFLKAEQDVNIDMLVTETDVTSVKIVSEDYNYNKLQILNEDKGARAKSKLKRVCKVLLYDFFNFITGENLPYGALTGIRPTKLFYDTTAQGKDPYKYFVEDLRVSVAKTNLIKSIIENQRGIYGKNEKEVDVFVNIPMCTSRCSYCSFISAEIGKIAKLVKPYVELLRKEIELTKQIVKQQNLTVRSVYIGGGTPTSLPLECFESVLKECSFECKEFTVEAGRPDTITKEKLDIMEACGVTRISINPQTFNQKTLDLIGRKHTIEDIYSKFRLARNYPFLINMDLIAMLPEETLEEFKNSVNCAVALNPDNITVHTLALKAGSVLKETNYDNTSKMAEEMVDYSNLAITSAGYIPYYMYRQKYMSGNLENVGYCKPKTACIYNIDIMEETHSIIANGAGAIAKKVINSENRIERLANPKGIEVYLERAETILQKKKDFFA
ncbi:MAG: coproporphyrinogen dehydrogenase HemZ [Clostridia bacterium]